MIGIVDYGLGNVQAFANIYKRLNIAASLVSTAESLAHVDHIILPGVGSFDWAMQRLQRSGLRQVLDHQVLEKNIPVLGVCVGMQMMARSSQEGSEPGLGWIDAEVRRFSFTSDYNHFILPHMGWNDVTSVRSSLLLDHLNSESRFYFLHSYYFSPGHELDVIATSNYGGDFACAVQSSNCYGVQFHPEKSHGWGIQLLKNFAEI